MRLGIDGREVAGGVRTGIGRYLVAVVQEAVRQGMACLVYADRDLSSVGELKDVETRVLSAGPAMWWDQVGLPRRLKADRISVFLSPYYKGPIMASCPVVLTIHDLLFINYMGRPRPVYDRVMTGLVRLHVRRAAAVITDSEHSRRTIIDRLGTAPDRVTAIPLSVGEEFRPVPAAEDVLRRYGIRTPYLLAVGNFLPHKNLPRLVQAFASLPDDVRGESVLVLAGDHTVGGDPVRAEIGRLGMSSRVVLTGFVDGAHLPALYSGCEVFVMPSLDEGFGLPAVEAMACGAPVIVSDRASLPEVVGEAGLFANPDRAAAIAAALTLALSDRGLREDLKRRSLGRAESFRGARHAQRVLEILRSVEHV
jgi:glycosyltransferase involved in cell wall biosynthesis